MGKAERIQALEEQLAEFRVKQRHQDRVFEEVLERLRLLESGEQFSRMGQTIHSLKKSFDESTVGHLSRSVLSCQTVCKKLYLALKEAGIPTAISDTHLQAILSEAELQCRPENPR